MKITNSTTAKDLADRTKTIMFSDEIPNMKLKDTNRNNKFINESDKNFKFWLDRLQRN